MNKGNNCIELLRRKVKGGHSGRWDTVRNEGMELIDGTGADTAIAGQARRTIGTVGIRTVASRTRFAEDPSAFGDLRRGEAGSGLNPKMWKVRGGE